MNYLAHAYLSFNVPEIVAGNMISDFVKGKRKFDYSNGIQKGIQLHRLIDNFTDSHVSVKEAKQCFKATAGLYSGAFVDVAFDHFLSKDNNEFPGGELMQFALKTYAILNSLQQQLPEKFLMMLPYMEQQNWLIITAPHRELKTVLQAWREEQNILLKANLMFNAFEKNYDHLNNCYANFFHEVKAFAQMQMEQL